MKRPRTDPSDGLSHGTAGDMPVSSLEELAFLVCLTKLERISRPKKKTAIVFENPSKESVS